MTAPAAKRCTRCGVEKPLHEYSPKEGKPRSACKACEATARRTSYHGVTAPRPDWPEDERTEPGIPIVGPHEPQPTVEKLDQVAEHRLKQRVRELEAANRRLIADLSDAQAFADLNAASIGERGTAATIVPRERTSGLREGTPLILASDWHIEEEVRPEQVAGRNRYNLEISARRMERFFQSARWGIDFNRQAFQIRDAILWLGGDFITNYLHADNIESNLLSPVQAISYAFDSIRAGISFILEDQKLERLVVPCNDGNHGRLTDKTRSASRVANSIEWLLYHQLSQAFAGEPRVEFKIAQGSHLYLDVYSRTVHFTHGDEVRYQGGIGGIMVPLLRAIARWDSVRRSDLNCVAHFHQLIQLRNLIVNGSLIGYGPYSFTIGAQFEQPCQSLTMLEPRRFNSVAVPLWVSDHEQDEAAA